MADTDYFTFINQALDVTLDTGVDLTAETGNVKIDVKDPSGTVTEETPTIDSPPTDGLITKQFAVDYFSTAGTWELRSRLVTQKTPGRNYFVEVIPGWEIVDIPTAAMIRDFLEGYCITAGVISDAWLIKRRDRFIVPFVERIIRQSLMSESTATEFYSGNGGSILILNRRPIIELTSLSYTNYAEINQFVINVQSIQVIAEEGILKARYDFREDNWRPVFARGQNNIRVQYTYGYETVPDDIQEAILYLCVEQALGFVADRTGGGSSLSTQGYNRSYGPRGKYSNVRNDLYRQANALLRQYMTSVVGQ